MNRMFRLRIVQTLLLLLVLPGSVLQAQSKREKRAGPKEFSTGGPCDTSAWKLVFHDEFNGTALDGSKWAMYYPYSSDGSERCESCRSSSGNNTIYRDSLVSVADGLLTLGVRAKAGTWYSFAKEHESGMVHSIGGAKFTHGRFEARCRIPSAGGLWPAFWGFGGGTEIDVFEICSERPRWLKASLHRWEPQKFSHTGKHRTVDLSRAFHTYAMEWDEDEVRWYLDGRMVHSRSRFVNRRGKPLPACDRPPGELHTAPYFPRNTDALSVILNLAVSYPNDYCKGPREALPWPAGTALVVDHVRVYQRQPQDGLSDLCSTPRVLRTDADGTLSPGSSRRLWVQGPHDELTGRVPDGLEVTAREPNGITVRATGTTGGQQCVRVTSVGDPCAQGPLALEACIEVRRD